MRPEPLTSAGGRPGFRTRAIARGLSACWIVLLLLVAVWDTEVATGASPTMEGPWPLVQSASTTTSETPADVPSGAGNASESEPSQPDLRAVAPEARGARQLLHVLGVSPGQLGSVRDGIPLEEMDEEALSLVLHRLGRFGRDDLDQWMHEGPPPDQLWHQPQRFRAAMYHVAGTILDLQVVELPPHLSRLYPFSHIYYLTVLTAHHREPWLVITPKVPASWLASDQPWKGQPGGWQGMFYQLVQGDEFLRPVWLASRTAWFPRSASPVHGLSGDHLRLAAAGVDIGRLQEVRPRGPLTAEDTEAFYEVLSAVGRMPVDSIWRQSVPPTELASFLGEPRTQIGRLFRLHGTARRAVRIEVPRRLADRHHLDHYFEVEVFVPLQTVVRFVDPSRPANVKTFSDYPVVFCTPTLPDGMPLGDNLHQPVRVAGFYYKLWTYRSEYMSSADDRDKGLLQVSPLLIGSAIQAMESPRPSPFGSLIAATVAGVCLVGFGVWAAFYAFGDRRAQQRLRRWQRQRNTPDSASP